jgi:hypothetical protein
MAFCSKCGKEVEEGKDFCSSCGASLTGKQTEKPSTAKKIGQGCAGIVGLLLLLCVLLAMCSDDESSSASSSNSAEVNKQPEITISAKALLNEYKNNELRAEQNYKGKRAQITGFVDAIDNTFDILTVNINGGGDWEWNDIHAYFSDNDKADVAALNKGQKITVICTIADGGDLGGIGCQSSKIVK